MSGTHHDVARPVGPGTGQRLTKRGVLRVYLGAAPGVGKTYDMLSEGHRRLGRGTDVVIGYVETHGRANTAALIEGLEVIPRQTIQHRGATFTEMDLRAVLARRPEVALVDELAHTNVPGAGNEKRWQDVHALLDAGIDVITTVNIQHLESLNDVVETITGIRQHETVPDEIVRRADQIELVDMSPQALRRRLAHGNVYAAEKIDAALTNFFRVGNLTALRELALLWVADRVDAALEAYRADNDINQPWPARERVVVALTGGPDGEALVRRGARIAHARSRGELIALHVSRSDGVAGATPEALIRQRDLVESLDGTFHNVLDDDIAHAILGFSRSVNASHIVIGETARSRLRALLAPSPGADVIRGSGEMDVVVVTHDDPAAGSRSPTHRPRTGLTRRRRGAAWALAIVGPTAIGLALQDAGTLSLNSTLFLALTVAVALLGGLPPALAAALLSGAALNYFATEPRRTLWINQPSDVAVVVVMVAAAVAVSLVVDRSARQTAAAARARAESDTLTMFAGSVLRGEDDLTTLLERVRITFHLQAAALLQRTAPHAPWTLLASSGVHPPSDPDHGNALPVDELTHLVVTGRDLSTSDARVLSALAAQLGALIERDRLRHQAASARLERARSDIRTALLAALSHDLRSPLAGIKVSVSALRTLGPSLPDADRAELLAGIENSADRLQGLIDNLLDLSRLDAGALVLRTGPVALDEIVPRALTGIPTERVDIDVSPSVPPVRGDAGLIERIVANLVENALRYSPPDRPVQISAGTIKDRVVLRVIDRGPGVPQNRLGDIFHAFQRLGDVPAGQGVGLGLAVASGFAEANGGTLEAEQTPGGGLTMVLTLPVEPDQGTPEGGDTP